MSTPTSQQICAALSSDLNKGSSKAFTKVVNDAARKTFTASMAGAVVEFPHKQPDSNFWDGFKYYGSGSRNRIRIKRTPKETAEPNAKPA